MRQHVNPLSKNFDLTERIPSLTEMFKDSELPLHLDIGSADGQFLFDIALVNSNWNYIGIEIRERLVNKARLKVREREIKNLYFVFGNANNILKDFHGEFINKNLKSISLNFPDPWFKKRHHKRRVVQPRLINILSNYMEKGSLIFVKTDVRDLFDYMNCNISDNTNFKKIDQNDLNFSQTFNPDKVKTNREKYAIVNKLRIFERIYVRV
tara:strand:- start:524 stop:1153 length:630 start_codon:yes stop_codon:yes gene_type:complete